MKIILMHDMPNTGRKYEIKEVSDGYARNYLLPKKLAQLATPANLKAAEIKRKQHKDEEKIQQNIFEKNLEALKGIKLEISCKTNEKGHLFAGIKAENISDALKNQHRIDIPADIIELKNPIKETGEHKVKVKNTEFILSVISSE